MIENNPARYRELSEPFEDREEASAAIDAFVEEVKASRIRHGISDVVVNIEVYIGPDAHRASSSLYLGSFVNRLPILARAYGAARAEHEEMLGDLIDEGRKSVKGPR